MKPKVLIVGTVPYNEKSTSRAFESYFSNWEKENLAQIFSNTKKPAKGHCGTLFQITDQRLVMKRFRSYIDTGVIFNFKDLPEEWSDNSLEVNSSIFSKLYSWGSKKSPLTYFIRRYIWNKKYWCTEKLNNWLDEFNPDCVFLSFSDDFFISEIAMYIAERFKIPIVSAVGDDYFFNRKFTISPFYYLYKKLYRDLIGKVFQHEGSTIYIGNKIRDKYNHYFGLNGKTVYLTSSIIRRNFKAIDRTTPKIVYCGNIRIGRNNSLNEIGVALGKINSEYILDIYSNETDDKYYKLFESNPNIRFHGSISYSKVQKVMLESDIIVVVEGFDKKDVDISRYSLSTKVADSLATGAHVLGYGSIECGAIEYLKEIKCGIVCTSYDELVPTITKLLDNPNLQRKYYDAAAIITEQNHNIVRSTQIFEGVVEKAVKDGGKL